VAWLGNKRVYVCSPFRGATANNTTYAHHALRDSLARDEAPISVQLLYSGDMPKDSVFDKDIPIPAGVAWLKSADLLAVYSDRGISESMWMEIGLARQLNIPVEMRSIGSRV